jgi:signal transduction histidine kinase
MSAAESKRPRILLVEDDIGLATLLSGLLADEGYACEVASLGRHALDRFGQSSWDLVLLDYALPDLKANQVIAAAREAGGMPPFIVLTGNGDERVAVELMKLGACDYLVKDAALLQRLPSSIARVLEELRVKRQLREAESALKRSEAELEAIHEHAPMMMGLVDAERWIRRLNRAAREFFKLENGDLGELRVGRLLGCVRAQSAVTACGNSLDCAACELRLKLVETLRQGINHRRIEVGPRGLVSGPSRNKAVLVSMARVEVDGAPMVLLCLEDVTEQRRLEEQFRQAQKMEAVGQLAGGVAHDFNNILTGFMMHLGLMQCDPLLPGSAKEALRDLESQAQRAAGLTRQLLLFSRRQMIQARPIQLNEVVDSMLKMLGRVLGEHVAIEFSSQAHLPAIKADLGMMEQVIMNLCVNARDAMPGGGRLSLATAAVGIREGEPLECADARPGDFVRLSVSDTGCGMDEPTLARAFEPFFTTKEVGKGSGLGLATVFGIVKQHDGWIQVRTAVGRGSTFSIFLPVCGAAAVPLNPRTAEAKAPGGRETILLVEDDPQVRRMASATLRSKGYQVLEAEQGREALAKWERQIHTVDLLFTDMIMPSGLTGLDLADRLRARKRGLKVIVFSGYSPELLDARVAKARNIVYLPKPCSPEVLSGTVRECLDAGREKSAGP